MDRAGGDGAALPALFDGPHGPAPGGPEAHRRSAAQQRRACCGSSTSTGSWWPGSLITMGTLGDRIGRRRLLMIGAAAFGVASVVAAFSTSAAMLIATRALLGVAGATIAPSTLSLIRNMFLDPGAAHHGDRHLDHQLLAGRRDRAARRRRAAGVLLVGVGVPARRSGDGAAARRRTEAAAGVPGSRRGPARSAQRRAVAGRRAGDDLRAQADRPGRCSPSAPCCSSWPASPSASCSYGASSGCLIRSSTCVCSGCSRSARRWRPMASRS